MLLTLDEHFADPLRFDPRAGAGVVVVSLADEHPAAVEAAGNALLRQKRQTMRRVAAVWNAVAAVESHLRALDGEPPPVDVADAASSDPQEREARRQALVARRAGLLAEAGRVADDVEAVEAAHAEVLAEHLEAVRRTTEAFRPPAAAPPAAGEGQEDASRIRVEGRTIERPAADERRAFAASPSFRRAARRTELRADLRDVWGSLAGELAAALANLLAVLERHDPAGELWVASAGGVVRRVGGGR